MQEAAAALSPLLDVTVLTQDDLPKPALLARFTAEETSCLFATAGLFQGIDVPGRTLSLVTIDRLPFPRPDEPLLKARRERLGPEASGASTSRARPRSWPRPAAG
jgi:ATP-dependent DNA helicase DinG